MKPNNDVLIFKEQNNKNKLNYLKFTNKKYIDSKIFQQSSKVWVENFIN